MSKSHHGKAYFVNNVTGATQWDIPTESASAGDDKKVQCLHILKKHAGSRRPSSWRCKPIVQSKDDSIAQILSIRQKLEKVLDRKGYEAMEKLFRDIAASPLMPSPRDPVTNLRSS